MFLMIILLVAAAILGGAAYFNTISTQGEQFVRGHPSKRFYNRTGGTVYEGYVGFIDEFQGDAASTSVLTGQQNIVKVTTALMAKGDPKLVVFKETAADDEQARAIAGEDAIVRILVEGTTDIAKGDGLKPVNAQYYLVKGTIGTDRIYAIALEAFTTDGTGVILARLLPQSRT